MSVDERLEILERQLKRLKATLICLSGLFAVILSAGAMQGCGGKPQPRNQPPKGVAKEDDISDEVRTHRLLIMDPNDKVVVAMEATNVSLAAPKEEAWGGAVMVYGPNTNPGESLVKLVGTDHGEGFVTVSGRHRSGFHGLFLSSKRLEIRASTHPNVARTVVQLGVHNDNSGAIEVYDSDGKWKAGLDGRPPKPETPAK
jgi:hypothetical protein